MPSVMSARQETYTIAEAAKYLRVSQDTIRRLIKRGLMRRSLALRKVLIPGEDVENFVEKTL